ncbi:MAG: tRNA (N(6)-L-threonylcarbamoyladenosine(37)-C(2))-methylthiotransferase MtaB [Anaerostipes sp.]|jgi:threonylcarbamoyladenosine tRNA methylthiotransferase MtaB|nr:tRNA (N(6)-L-threonylcarbamoyladenosine(37)-C(2))-methylthiotransferase MtaB [Anaerostipes sp.]MDD3745416.1 tRNA (N(6)-L-threonylcarbamoyladenosine(37)-C(2))-methylthiotransferase MtaB [Anaerostipes sp.]
MSLKNRKATIITLGCKVNQYESDAMYEMLKKAGVREVSPKDNPDIYIVNTCSVTNMAERKSRQMLHRAKKRNPNVVVAAVGCYAQVGKDDLEKDANIDLIIGNNRKHEIVSILEAFYEEHRSGIDVIDINDQEQVYEEMSVEHINDHTRAYIKVQDGCNQFCSYCIIPYARGRVRSRKMEDVIHEISNLAKAGYQEFVITGIHVCSYGTDLEEDITLIDLIEKISQIEEVRRIRLGSLEPRIVTEENLKRLKKIKEFCPHFHLSIQSGCDNTLKRMNRKYTTSDIKDICQLIRKHFDTPALTTDIIVGFPGETKEDFEKTKSFLEEINLYEMHVFKYSKRKGTKAAVMEDQVPDHIKAKRSGELLDMSKRHQKAFETAQIGKVKEVLFEEKLKDDTLGRYVGHTKEYIKVAMTSNEPLENKIRSVELTKSLLFF